MARFRQRQSGAITAALLLAIVAVALLAEAAAAQEAGTGWLGVQLKDLTKEEADALGWQAPRGAKLMKPVPGGPAEAAGLKPDDVFVSLDGVEIESTKALAEALSKKAAGTEVKLAIMRAGSEKRLSLKLGARPAQAARPAQVAPLYEQPVLVIDPRMHTASITSVAVDAAGLIAVTGSWDKTVRVWQLSDGKLLQTVRIAAGPGNIGKIYAVAMSPEGGLAAVGGWTKEAPDELIYLFEPRTGRMAKTIPVLPATTHSLAFSPDGRYLAAGLGSGGLRVFDRDRQWAEAFRDTDYGGTVYGLAFAADGQLAAASWDGMIRLYGRGFKPMVSPRKVAGGSKPFCIAFRPDGAALALGYQDAAAVDLFEGHSLSPLPVPDTGGLGNGNLSQVTWSKDGGTLFAGGRGGPVLAWGNAGARGALCRPGTIQLWASRPCRTAAFWLARRIHS